MSELSAIEWTDATWNPVTGCTKVSPGCANCYIERTPPFRMAGRRFVKGAIPVYPPASGRRSTPTVLFPLTSRASIPAGSGRVIATTRAMGGFISATGVFSPIAWPTRR